MTPDPAATDAPPPAGQGQPRLHIPPSPVLVAGLRRAVMLTPDGEIADLTLAQAAQRAKRERPILAHGPAVATRLKTDLFPCFDVLELFAFIRPATFCLPTVRGLAEAVGLERPESLEAEAAALIEVIRRLLREVATAHPREQGALRDLSWGMGQSGSWGWSASVLAALGVHGDAPHRANVAAGLRVWERLPETSEHAPEPPSGNKPITPEQARARLAALKGSAAEDRPQQADYTEAATDAFQPRDAENAPRVVLAEAGTGVGKTLGYIAPASVWAEENEGAVWIATYTRNLQRQLDAELDRLHPDRAEKSVKVVVRKGRENYLCLLNLEESITGATMQRNPRGAVALGLMARWALATRDGDMVGGDFPGWLVDILGRNQTLGLADRRGECVFSACAHYDKCFIERAVRRARRARIVVANHALVMVQAALGGLDERLMPTRYVFDEGHHVFDAADSAFSAHLTGMETAELRRWLLGAEGDTTRSRARGLKRRAEDLVADVEEAAEALTEALHAARVLPGPSWGMRIAEGSPHGQAEKFLALVRDQVYARVPDSRTPYSLETEATAPIPGLLEAAVALAERLERVEKPLKALAKALENRLDDEAADLDAAQRLRMESLIKSLERRAIMPLTAWRNMLGSLTEDTPEQFVDWFAVERIDGRDVDVGMHRHWIDPTVPFAKAVIEPAHGALITSATLRDGSGDAEADWAAAERRTGAAHLAVPAARAAVPSPFDYAARTRVLVVTDVRKDDMMRVASAYRELFLAANGGALGLFTAISRLRAVHERIAQAMDEASIPLHAQHVDGMDPATLVEIFRGEENACLLGTDAMRDGVDVPGRSLRLLVFDRVPWPRPDILHRARKAHFGGRSYDDMIARLRLKQAFGRLVRRGDDAGVFVLLDPMMPSRLLGAFPDGVEVRRVGLAEAVKEVRGFLR
ncbi:DinG family ATP-dependent helicase YoaA [Caenispirillum salinarum AK4]|uniref:DinG family ATP-dependent helicase YoaA n=1 Tax=Caenispirillum salinarum AK4 TaxID=1238182 RepID=K9GTU4_9PROT|nr:ATP-dependent DNA helicase [Caenispirillum salinarum]EKV28139.1 DinG family ATP-dependent helicase YoaA [Caenispirillum salinarum AK4]